MQVEDKKNFRQAMDFLRASYPSSRLDDAAWQVTLRVYWDQMIDLPWPVVSQAVRKSTKEFPEWFPTAGQLRQICEPLAKAWRNREAREALGPDRQIPKTVGGQEGYILDADSPWEKLARYWAAENVHFQKNPEVRPRDIGPQRFKQFWQMWGQADAPTSLPSRTSLSSRSKW